MGNRASQPAGHSSSANLHANNNNSNNSNNSNNNNTSSSSSNSRNNNSNNSSNSSSRDDLVAIQTPILDAEVIIASQDPGPAAAAVAVAAVSNESGLFNDLMKEVSEI